MRHVHAASLLTLAVSLATASPAAAQEAPAPAPTPAEPALDEAASITEDRIVVTGQRMRGEVDTPHPPVAELNEADIAAYGAGSIAELMEALGSLTGGGSGRGSGSPIFLVNGRRISNFLEIASFPPEAIERVQVLAAETSQQFGYSPDQRLVNIILKENYASREVQGMYGQPADGGFSRKQADATYLRLDGPSRLNFNVSWNDLSPLTEAERGVIQTPGSVPTIASDPDPALYRSLIADSYGLQGDVNFATQLSPRFSLSLTGSVQRNESLRYQGLDTVLLTAPDGTSALRTFGEEDPLTIDTRSTNYTAATTLDAWLGDWQITGTANGNHAVAHSVIDRRADPLALEALQTAALAGTLPIDADLTLPDAGFDRADSTSDTANTLVTATGRPLRLPGGPVAVTLDSGFNWMRIESRDTRGDGTPTTLKRGNLSGGVNLSIPLTSRSEDFGAAIGDLTLNAQAGVDHLSDFGTLNDWSLGLNWGVTERLSFNVTHIQRDAAPSLAQLGNPETETVNVPIFDLARGETVLATVIGGGNPFLPAQSQRDWRFSLNWQLPNITPAIQQARLNIEFFRNHSEDIASGFPVLTPTIEAAFPDRVTRDETGRLVSIDQRPITLARQDAKRLQAGLFMTGPLGKARPQPQPQPQPQSQTQAPPNNAPRTFALGGPPGAQGPGAPSSAAPIDPARFQELRARLCAPEAANTVPTSADLEGLPEPLLARARNPDGTINAERWAEVRGPLCSAQTNVTALDPQRMAQLREQFCPKPGEAPREIPDEELEALPPQLLERLKGPDGKVDRQRLNQLLAQFCSAPAPQAGAQQGQAGQQAPMIMVITGPAPAGNSAVGGAPPGAMMGGGSFITGSSPDGRGRWFANVNYSYEIDNEVLVAEGGPLLDLLGGDALSGSLPRHSGNFNLGLFYGGFGINLNARYVGSSRINGSGLPGSTDLFFDDFTTFNLRLFADLNQRTELIESVPLLKNTRITLGVNNVFDARQRITDQTGEVPLRYQPYLVDPVGRFLTLELRKMF